MHPKIKMILIWGVVIFAIYAIITSPERAADIVQAIWDIITSAFMGIVTFFNSLLD